MLTRIDRIQMTSADALDVVWRFSRLLDAAVLHRDPVPALAAQRTTLAVGDSLVEVLTPDGSGPVAEHLESRRGGPFAAGVAVADLDACRARLAAAGVNALDLGEQLFLDADTTGVPGLQLVISQELQRRRVGCVDGLYEVTHLTDRPADCEATLTRLFGNPRECFVPISSDTYGYEGSLTLFRPGMLHRIETIHPHDRSKTMGRYFERFGHGLYMCYAETPDVAAVRERAREFAPRDWTGDQEPVPDGMFLNPRALGGVMMGISRTTHAWSWSGHPEWVVPQARPGQ